MKKLLILVAALTCGAAMAKGHSSHVGGDHAIKGYTKKDGTYVEPSHAKNPNSSKEDNYSTKGNVNPYTGKEGTKDPEPKPYSPNGK